MSCQSVMPIPPTSGVAQRIPELHIEILPLKKVLANIETEKASICEKKSVAISGCEPFIVKNFTKIAQIAVDPLVRGPTLTISIMPIESIE